MRQIPWRYFLFIGSNQNPAKMKSSLLVVLDILCVTLIEPLPYSLQLLLLTNIITPLMLIIIMLRISISVVNNNILKA